MFLYPAAFVHGYPQVDKWLLQSFSFLFNLLTFPELVCTYGGTDWMLFLWPN